MQVAEREIKMQTEKGTPESAIGLPDSPVRLVYVV